MILRLFLAMALFAPAAFAGDGVPVASSRVQTAVLDQYDDAPRTPDSDDPAIWVSRGPKREGLVIGTLKDAGLQVYDLGGAPIQTVIPANRPAVAAEDPPVPGPQPDAGTSACPESESGETFGRFNNVAVSYGFALRDAHGRKRAVDLAVVSDRGCDRLRVFRIDPGAADGPLVEITAANAPRVFPAQYAQPSPVQPTGETTGVYPNPLDDQNTAYGVALWSRDTSLRAYVTQRNRSVVAELVLFDAGRGRVSYEKIREFRFDPVFSIPAAAGRGRISWTPCRESAEEDPQFEGLVVDAESEVLYAAQEVVGIWKIALSDRLPAVVNVPQRSLIEPVTSYGAPWWAVPDEGEFSCEDEAPTGDDGSLPEGTVAQAGNPAVGGEHLEADAEGLAIYYAGRRSGYLIASSQGNDTFHVYRRQGGFTRASGNRWIGEFQIEGVGETDGHEVVNVPVGSFTRGLFVTQNGAAPGPNGPEEINGFEYDGSTRFEFVDWDEIADLFEPPLRVETRPPEICED